MPLVNALLVRSGQGWRERTDPASITANTRFEAYLALGAIQSEDGVDAYADAQLDIYAIAQEEVVAGIAPIGTNDVPYQDYEVGDTLTVPNSAGSGTVERVRAITVTENDDTGVAVFSPTFKDFILERAEQISVAIKKMSNGTIAGSSQVAQPIHEQFRPWEVRPDPLLGTFVPFIVVANDGTGDFADPKLAIDSVSAGDPAVIYVKNTGTLYSTLSVDISGKIITLWGEASAIFNTGGTSGPSWTLSGGFTTSSTTQFQIKGMQVNGGNTNFGLVAGAQLYLDGAGLGGGGNQIAMDGGTVIAHNSKFALHTASYTGFLLAWNCTITMPNATMTLTTGAHIWQNCILNPGGASTHVTIAQGAATGNFCQITGCSFGEFNELILSGWDQATFVGNSNRASVGGGVLGTKITTLTCNGCDKLLLDSQMFGTVLALNASQRYHLGGIWYRGTIAADGGSICATFDGNDVVGNVPATTLTISGDHNVGSLYINGSSTNGLLVSGDTNVLSVTGTNNAVNLVNLTGNSNKIITEVGATTADTGAGNVFL